MENSDHGTTYTYKASRADWRVPVSVACSQANSSKGSYSKRVSLNARLVSREEEGRRCLFASRRTARPVPCCTFTRPVAPHDLHARAHCIIALLSMLDTCVSAMVGVPHRPLLPSLPTLHARAHWVNARATVQMSGRDVPFRLN